VVVPVTDVDRAKAFYVDQLGFVCDADTQPTPQMRVVQLTPPGSRCSLTLGPLVVEEMPAVTAMLQLVVTDLDAARAELLGRGVGVSEIQELDPRDGGRFCFLADPDGNNWAVQEIRSAVGAER
jgi:catechol 2,3-dioxygenase-like lactoylglutathione lyase family enzyme